MSDPDTTSTGRSWNETAEGSARALSSSRLWFSTSRLLMLTSSAYLRAAGRGQRQVVREPQVGGSLTCSAAGGEPPRRCPHRDGRLSKCCRMASTKPSASTSTLPRARRLSRNSSATWETGEGSRSSRCAAGRPAAAWAAAATPTSCAARDPAVPPALSLRRPSVPLAPRDSPWNERPHTCCLVRRLSEFAWLRPPAGGSAAIWPLPGKLRPPERAPAGTEPTCSSLFGLLLTARVGPIACMFTPPP